MIVSRQFSFFYAWSCFVVFFLFSHHDVYNFLHVVQGHDHMADSIYDKFVCVFVRLRRGQKLSYTFDDAYNAYKKNANSSAYSPIEIIWNRRIYAILFCFHSFHSTQKTRKIKRSYKDEKKNWNEGAAMILNYPRHHYHYCDCGFCSCWGFHNIIILPFIGCSLLSLKHFLFFYFLQYTFIPWIPNQRSTDHKMAFERLLFLFCFPFISCNAFY